MLTNIDNFLLFHMAGTCLYPHGQAPEALVFFGIVCAKWLIYFIPLHLLWLNFKCLMHSLSVRLLLPIILGLLISFLIGCIYYKMRPFMVYPDISLLWHRASPSFPSDHALIWSAYCLSLYKYRQRAQASFIIVWIAVLLALLTCWGRVFVGIHYPFDILGGLFLGAVCAWGVDKFLALNKFGF